MLLEWSLWVSERIGWPVVGTSGAGLVAVTWIAVACKRARKRRLQGAGYLRRTVRMNRALWWWAFVGVLAAVGIAVGVAVHRAGVLPAR